MCSLYKIKGKRFDDVMKMLRDRQALGPVDDSMALACELPLGRRYLNRQLPGPISRAVIPYMLKVLKENVYGSLITIPDHLWELFDSKLQRRILKFHSIHLLYSGQGKEVDTLLHGIKKMDSPELRAVIPFHVPRQGNRK